MTPTEASQFEGRLSQKCNAMSALSLRAIKAVIDDSKVPESDKTIYRLEHHWRLKGGESPYRQVLRKLADEHNLSIVIDSAVTFSKP
jgi:hypothetical protein